MKSIPAPDWMIIDAVRYCIGRRSYQVGITTAWLHINWSKLSPNTQAVITQDLKEAIESEDRAKGSDYKPMGGKCDSTAWRAIYKEIATK